MPAPTPPSSLAGPPAQLSADCAAPGGAGAGRAPASHSHASPPLPWWGLPAQVRYLKVIEKSGYQALPWVRYITTAGNYEIRMS